MSQRKHRCGGTLEAANIQVSHDQDDMVLVYVVPGYLCSQCGDTLIDRDTMRSVEKSQVPTFVLKERQTATTQAPAQSYRHQTVCAPVSV